MLLFKGGVLIYAEHCICKAELPSMFLLELKNKCMVHPGTGKYANA